MLILDDFERVKQENATLRRRVEDLVEQLTIQPPTSCLPFGGGKRKAAKKQPITDKHEMTPN